MLVVHKKPSRENRYLILNRKKNWEGWELAKGHLEEDDYEHTVKLELREEAGIDEGQIQSIEDLDHTAEWSFEDEDGEEVQREYKAFLVEVTPEAIADVEQNPSDEHSQAFFLSKEDCEGLLTYDNHKEVLELGAEKAE
ncbi:hypothetical protein HBNXNv_0818 [Candidatus Nanohalovita haloferacivicina]|nr:hypothetical protein HBNXNv_0818 [Candidatus Nanohalobia archaeon BNXNv]